MSNLVLSRRRDESIEVDGKCKITVLRIGPDSVRLAIEAEESVEIWRSELLPLVDTESRLSRPAADRGES